MNHDFWQYLANLAAFATIAGFAFNHMRGRRADKKDMEASRKADQKEMQTERENLITWRGAVDSKLKQGRREARRLRRRDGRHLQEHHAASGRLPLSAGRSPRIHGRDADAEVEGQVAQAGLNPARG